MENYTIFGPEQATATRSRATKGFHISVNFKHGNVYLNSEAKRLVFGDFKEGSLIVINSAIEQNWYIAKSPDARGFECKNNDKIDGSLRVNGAKKVFEKIADLMKADKNQRALFTVSETPIEFQGLKLYKITL